MVLRKAPVLFLILFAVAFLSVPGTGSARYASIVIDAESGRILHSENEDTRNYPASLTKIMTLYMVFEALESGSLTLDQQLVVSRHAAGMPPSHLGLGRGSTISVTDAILALVTKSANDVAVVIAEAIGGTESEFAELMTERARQLGMSRTTFRNASGLPNRRQLSTARDMAVLGIRIREDFPQYYEYFSTTHFEYGGRTYRNHNTLLSSYEGTDGIKTGYIRASGFNLVASVEREGRRIIGVVFGGETGDWRDRHMRNLLDRGFARLLEEEIPSELLVADARELSAPAPEEVVPQGDADAGVDLSELQATRWTIQVGAFSRAEAARTVAQQAFQALGELGRAMADDQVVVVDTSGGLHRSRVTGFDRQSAHAACQALIDNDFDCIVFQPRS